jgi:hypothetical protein
LVTIVPTLQPRLDQGVKTEPGEHGVDNREAADGLGGDLDLGRVHRHPPVA